MKNLVVLLAAAGVVQLGGCYAKCWQCQVEQCYRTPDGKLQTVEEMEAEQAEEARRAAEEKRKEEEQREQLARTALEQQAKRQAIAQAAVNARIAEDEARGYKHVAFADFYLDQKSLPLGSKRAVTGFYRVTGQLETLVDMPADNAPRVILVTESAPREARAKMLACRRSLCRGTFLGHTAKCEVTWLGNPLPIDVCLAVDDVW